MVRVQQGDREAYRALLDDIGPAIAGFLRRRVADVHEVADVYQDTLIALHRGRHTYEPSRPFEPWMFAIARNVAADHARRRAARLAREVLVEELPERAAEAAPGADAQLEQMLRRLPPAQREAFEMLKLEGLSVEVAAARARTSAGAIKVRAHRAYKALRELLGG
jgi:RNA polymerase sigma-70 factor (ECF subfamily)